MQIEVKLEIFDFGGPWWPSGPTDPDKKVVSMWLQKSSSINIGRRYNTQSGCNNKNNKIIIIKRIATKR